MEPLAQTISLARPRGLVWKQLEATGDWAIRFPANDGVVFTYILDGRCVFRTGDRIEQLRPGDFVLLVHPPVWVLGSDDACEPIDYLPGHPTAARLGQQPGPLTTTLGGRFVFDDANAALLMQMLPPLTLVRAVDDGAIRLRPLLDLLGNEAKANRAGQSFVLERLMELLLVEVIRNPHAAPHPPQPGLLQGLADPQIARAIQAMHADVSHRWTVAALASHAGMSRSSFAARFAATVGLSPIDYLLRWRMALAKDALRSGRMKLAKVAELIGYESVNAFSTAFTRTVGRPPSSFTRDEVRSTLPGHDR